MGYNVFISCHREQERRLIRNIRDHHEFADYHISLVDEAMVGNLYKELVIEFVDFCDLPSSHCAGRHYQVVLLVRELPSMLSGDLKTTYLTTPLSEESVKGVILHILGDYERRKTFSFKIGWDRITVPLSSIHYIERRARTLHVYGDSFKYRYYGKLDEAYEELAEHHFIRIHHSTIVNPHYVCGIDGDDLELKCGTRLAVSRRYKKETKQFLMMKPHLFCEL